MLFFSPAVAFPQAERTNSPAMFFLSEAGIVDNRESEEIITDIDNARNLKGDLFYLSQYVKGHLLLSSGKMRLAISVEDEILAGAKVSADCMAKIAGDLIMADVLFFNDMYEQAADSYIAAVCEMKKKLPDLSGGESPEIVRGLVIYLTMRIEECAFRSGKEIRDDLSFSMVNSPEYIQTSSLPQKMIIAALSSFHHLRGGDTVAARKNYFETVRYASALMDSAVFQCFLVQYKACYDYALGDYEKVLRAFYGEADIHALGHKRYLLFTRICASAEMHLGNKEKAVKLYDKALACSDSLQYSGYFAEIADVYGKYESDSMIYGEELAKKRYMIYIISGVTILIILLVIMSYYTFSETKRIKLSRRKLDCAVYNAEYSVKKRDFFISDMSHEIRTPLNAVSGFSQLLFSSGEIDEKEAREYCRYLMENAENMKRLFMDMKDLSEMENGPEFHYSSFDAVSLCRHAVRTMEASYLHTARFEFSSGEEKLLMVSDERRLRQVLMNLLVNANKFTSEGSIRLVLVNSKSDAVFTVEDTGCGIDPDKKDFIFERFAKLDEYTQGFGLGLSICRDIIQRMGGSIFLDGSYIKGARFVVTLPLINYV
ncbi:MAG: HAMP domain-containing histidine kinase [Bacteroidales bacterium]|nr:HAMP domain-containing histidine kinase [Bacteroidales bacterium]